METKKRISDLNGQIGQHFEYRERLAFLMHRQQEIEEELDLTKNQASAQLDAATTGVVSGPTVEVVHEP